MNASSVAASLRRAVARRVGIDARALAAFRVALGGLLVLDLVLRARHLTAFYTDAGVLPRALLAERAPLYATVSIHALSGAAWVQAVLFAVAGVAALALLVGYRTTLATVVSVILLASLHARNPVVLNAGDSVLRRLLVWSVFLPLGARWSVDAARRDTANDDDTRLRDRVVGVATAGLLVQVVVVYAVNGVLKLRGDRWVDGTAVRYVFSLDQFTVLAGDALTRAPGVLTAVDFVWLGMVVASPLLLVLTGRGRAAFAALFVGAHLGMLLTMRLGIFPLVSMAALLPFLPPAAWDELEARVPATIERPLGRVRRRLAGGRGSGDAERADGGRLLGTVGRWKRRVVPALAAGFLVFALVWTAMSVGVVETPDSVASVADPEERRWDMFAPEPLGVDGWLVAPGETESGERVDAFGGGELSWERPADLAATYPSARWRKYTEDIRMGGNDALRAGLADYLCGQWNAGHADDLETVAVSYVTEETRLDGPEPSERIELVERACAPATG